MPPDGQPVRHKTADETVREALGVGPSEEYLAMLRGEISASDYVAALKARVNATHNIGSPETRGGLKMSKGKLYATLERTARTFVQGFLGVVTADALNGGLSITLLESLEAGALAGAYAVLMAFAFPPRASAAPSEE